MDVSIAEARRRLKEVLDHVEGGHVVRLTRRGRVVAVIAPPTSPHAGAGPLSAALQEWRDRWDVGSWPDEDPFAGTRDPAPGPAPPW